jgi:hypothetical protein
LRETTSNALLLPSIAITSENLGFFDDFCGFFVIGKKSVCGGEREKKFRKKGFLIFLAVGKIFTDFFYEPPKLFWIIFKNSQAQKKFRDIFDWKEFKNKSVSPEFFSWIAAPKQQSFFPDGFDIEVRSECIYG